MSASPVAAARFVDRLIAEHRIIESTASAVRRHVERRDGVNALVALLELHQRVARHDGVDENVLFPLLAEAAELRERVVYLRAQHRATGAAGGALELALLHEDRDQAVRYACELHALLVGNHTLEEMVLYDCAEAFLGRDHGAVMRPGAPLAPNCVWHELQSPVDWAADIARTSPLATTSAW